MQQAGNYGGGGGGMYMPPAPSVPDYGNFYAPAAPSSSTPAYGSSAPYGSPAAASTYASTPPYSYNSSEMNAYGASGVGGGGGGAASGDQTYTSSQEPTYPAQEAPYNPNVYPSSQQSYAPAVPSYSPAVPSYENYNNSSPLASTSPAQGQGYFTGNNAPSYTGGSYGSVLQGYESGGMQSTPGYGGVPNRFDQVGAPAAGGLGSGGYEQEGSGGSYPQSRVYDRDSYSAQQESVGSAYDNGGGYAEVYAYDGGRGSEPYGARGTGSSSWNSGGSVGGGSFGSYGDSGGSKLARAIPKAETEDTGGGVQKYRVKMLPDMSSSVAKDVICQIGLDGVRMVDPGTSRTLRIYPLETITRWEVNEPSVFTFWAKSAVDFEQRSIRMQSSSYTTNAILDTITAACVQLCEMVGKDGPNKSMDGNSTTSDAGVQRKSSIADWVSIRPRAVSEEEKQHWVPDEAATKCTSCNTEFSAFYRRHHCRNCGDVFCDRCTKGRTPLTAEEGAQVVRVCDRCLAEVTQRLTNTRDVSKVPVQRTHEDLAKKLQEELERNAGRKASSTSAGNMGSSGNKSSGTSVLNCNKCGSITLVTGGNSRCPSCGTEASSNHGSGRDGQANSYGSVSQSSSHGPGARMREVACPTCTVHLQVQVPSFGTETVECGVCQHPFLVKA